jgi:hypothetical protein
MGVSVGGRDELDGPKPSRGDQGSRMGVEVAAVTSAGAMGSESRSSRRCHDTLWPGRRSPVSRGLRSP